MRITAFCASLFLALMINIGQVQAQATYIVNANDDTNDGNCNAAHCSLREAIIAANTDGGQTSRIEFQIPGGNPQVINLTATLPNITDANTTIDGTTQSGIIGDVILDCSGLPAVNDHVIEILADRTRIYGLEIRNFDVKSGGNVIQIGSAGASPQLCEIGGVNRGNIINNVTNGTGNPGNFGSAIYIRRARFAVIQGNYIGTNREANQALPIYNAGVFIEGDAAQYELNYVGGSMPGQGNVIVACGTAGVVVLTGEGFIRNNMIGVTDRQASFQFPNREGILSTSEIQIGGPNSLDGNYVGYNLTNGIRIEGDQQQREFEVDQNHCFNNVNFGIYVNNVDNVIIKRNICFQNDYGIGITDQCNIISVTENELYENNIGVGSALVAGIQGHLISNNSMYCNLTTGIEIVNNGYGSLPPPVITSTSPNEIRGTSRPGAVVEVFRENNRNCPNAPCQGYSLLGTTTANGAGNWMLTGAFGGGYNAVATQTDNRDNTSAFSNCVPVINTCSFVVSNVADSGPGSLRSAIDCANNTPGPDLIEFDIPGGGPHVITPLSPLPNLTDDGTTIDGTTQTGNFPMAGLIVLDGSQAGPGANGINMYGNGCQLYGLVIRNFEQVGVQGTMENSYWVTDIQIGAPDRGNVIVSNGRGIELWCESGCDIQGNFVGTNTAFQAGLGNANGGIAVYAGSGDNIIIGGDRFLGEGNYVCSNGGFGIRLGPENVANNFIPRIYGNTVGTDVTGTVNLANPGPEPGIRVDGLTRGSVIGGNAGRSNIVAFQETGIGVTSDFNKISQNSLYCNTVKGIDLFGGSGNNDVTPPVIEVATEALLSGTSKPLDLVELFLSDDTGCPGVPCQGKTFIAFVFTDNNGNWSLPAPFPIPVTNGMTVTATGTDGRQNTSEFSSCRLLCEQYKAQADHAGPFCEGDPIQLLGDAPITGTVVEYEWTGPMGYTSSEKDPADASVPGRYILKVTIDGCESVRDTIVVPAFLPRATSIYMDRLCAYESVTIGNEVFDINRPSGTAVLDNAAANGCDSVVTVSLSFRSGGLNVVNGVLCPGDSRTINGVVYDASNPSGTDTIPGGSVNGCDSVIRVNFTLLNEPQGALTPILCPGQFVLVNGVRYDENNLMGTERIIGGARNGCDSIVQIFLTYEAVRQGDLELPICPGGSALYNGNVYSEQNPTGTRLIPGGASNGCDSRVNISIRVLPEPMGTQELPICPGETVFYNGNVYSEQNPTGQERLLGMAANGCDSIVNVSIRLLPEPTGDISFEICPNETIDYNGTVYSAQNTSGQERFPGMGSNGCDSIVNVTINVLPEAVGSLSPQICLNEQFTFNGTIYDRQNPAGQERLTGMGSNGCDSIVNVQVRFFPEARGTLNQQLCQGQQFVFNGEVFDANRPSGDVVLSGLSSNGCDSIVFVQLSFVTEITESIDDVLCAGDEIIVNGRRYNESNPSGREVIPGGSVQGCDSVIIVNLQFRSLNASLSAESPNCPNTLDGRILVSQLGTPGSTYSYSLNSGTFVTAGSTPFYINNVGAGTQTVRFRDEFGCVFSFSLDVPGPAGLDLDLGPNLAILPGDQPVLTPVVLSFTPVQIIWSPSPYLSCTDCLSPTVVGLDQTQTFTLTLIDANGCEVTDQITIFVNADVQIFVPNAFTPNGDGINEVFNVTGNELIDQVNRLTIYDRWGVAVYDATNLSVGDPGVGWDGMINGKPALAGVYAYVAEVKLLNGKTRILTGDVTLLR